MIGNKIASVVCTEHFRLEFMDYFNVERNVIPYN